jgi:hypothetical protein
MQIVSGENRKNQDIKIAMGGMSFWQRVLLREKPLEKKAAIMQNLKEIPKRGTNLLKLHRDLLRVQTLFSNQSSKGPKAVSG